MPQKKGVKIVLTDGKKVNIIEYNQKHKNRSQKDLARVELNIPESTLS